jgi:hypothetical protein
MYVSMQEKEKWYDMRLLAGGYLFEDFVRRLDPKDPGADRSRVVGPGSRATADTFVVATCGRALVHRDLVGVR